MKIKIFLMIAAMLFATAATAEAQVKRPRELRKAYASPEEIVSLSRTMPFNQALLVFNDLSKKYLGKVIIDPESRSKPIGEDIDKMQWMDAMELILRRNDLWYEEYPDYIKIVPLTDNAEKLSETDKKAIATFNTREVVISAIFFETNESKLRQAGMSWDFFRGNDVNVGARLSAADTKTGLFEVDVDPKLDFGSILAAFKALESKQVGEVIASPQVTVKSGEEGRVQVGSDIAVTISDFAGNAITQFFSTGSIIKVKPVVIKHDSIDFVNLDLMIERSNASTSGERLEIKKSSSTTSVLLLDGEETIIGGLYINEETDSREGVPLLKDLPWWFFGLRYVFGFESKSVVKNELLILLKAELLPTLTQRFNTKLKSLRKSEIIRDEKREVRQRINDFTKQWQK